MFVYVNLDTNENKYTDWYTLMHDLVRISQQVLMVLINPRTFIAVYTLWYTQSNKHI